MSATPTVLSLVANTTSNNPTSANVKNGLNNDVESGIESLEAGDDPEFDDLLADAIAPPTQDVTALPAPLELAEAATIVPTAEALTASSPAPIDAEVQPPTTVEPTTLAPVHSVPSEVGAVVTEAANNVAVVQQAVIPSSALPSTKTIEEVGEPLLEKATGTQEFLGEAEPGQPQTQPQQQRPENSAGRIEALTPSTRDVGDPSQSVAQSANEALPETTASSATNSNVADVADVTSAETTTTFEATVDSSSVKVSDVTTLAPNATQNDALVSRVYTEPTTTHSINAANSVKSAVLVAASQSDSRIEVDLDPPELGSVRIELAKHEHGISARIVTEIEATSQLLQDNLTQLRKSLEESGVSIQDFEFQSQSDNSRDSAPEEQDESGRTSETGAFDSASESQIQSQITRLGRNGAIDVIA